MRLQPNRQFATESKSATGLEWHLCQYLEMCVQFSKLSICHRCMKFWLTFCLAHPLSHFHLPPCNANTIPSSYEIFFLIFFGHHLNKSFSFRACFYYCTSHSMFPLTFTSSIYQSLRFFFLPLTFHIVRDIRFLCGNQRPKSVGRSFLLRIS